MDIRAVDETVDESLDGIGMRFESVHGKLSASLCHGLGLVGYGKQTKLN